MAEDATAPDPTEALEAAVDEAITACDGDPRAAVRALLVTLDATEREVAALKTEVARATPSAETTEGKKESVLKAAA